MVEPQIDRRLALILSFLTSFCCLGYQQILALTLSDATGDYVLSQCVTLGVFLLGLGLGGLRSEKAAATWSNFLRIEWLLSLFGALSPSVLHAIEILLPARGIFLAATLPIFLLGFGTGFELPLLLRLQNEKSHGPLLATNYLGAFAAAVLVPLFFLPLFDVHGAALALGLTNFLTATLLLFPLRSLSLQTMHLMIAAALALAFHGSDQLASWHLRAVYFGGSGFGAWLGEMVRIRTKYQWIDILPPEFTEKIQGRQDFQIYLDRKIQLSSSTVARYHESMALGGANLLGRPVRRALILGGGDGLLARELVRMPHVERIDLVELDAKMIELARNQRELSKLNGRALEDPRVHIEIGDAFQFLRASGENYDLILIDLPFPYSLELSQLYSKEFYALAGRRLTADGILVADFPLPGGRRTHLPVLVHTLAAAGFPHPYAFGSEDFFVAVSHRPAPLRFDYSTLAEEVSDQTLSNLISRDQDVRAAESQTARINSVFFPYHFRHLEEPGTSSGIRPEHRILATENPGLLPVYIRRLERGLKDILQVPSSVWPLRLRLAWEQSLEEERDLSEEIAPGIWWPRFQIGFEGTKPAYQWFDTKSPEILRAVWNDSQCVKDTTDWVGVFWNSDLSVVEFYRIEDQEFRIRRYLNKSFVEETRSAIQPPPVPLLPPLLKDARAEGWRDRIQQRFLILPRSVSTSGILERVLYP